MFLHFAEHVHGGRREILCVLVYILINSCLKKTKKYRFFLKLMILVI